MKAKINRETTIGLSVLLVLLVIAGIVAIRRLMRPNLPPEVMEARTEEKCLEESPLHRSKREADSLPKLALPTPADMPRHDRLQALDDPGHWDTATKERRKEAASSSPASSLIVTDPPAMPGSHEDAKLHRREGEPATIGNRPDPPLTASDDRYSTAAPLPSPEHRTRESSRSMVVQVSDGESADRGPRPLDRYSAADSHARPGSFGPGNGVIDTIGPAPTDAPPPGRFDGPAAAGPVDPETARRHAEKAREHEREAAGGALVSAPVPPRNYDPAYSPPAGNATPYYASAPRGDAASSFSTASGYAVENLPRHRDEAPDRVRVQERLRDDGKYEVQPNDSYWTISERVYGSGTYFRALAEQNRGKAARPDRLPPGLMISTPPVAQLEKDYPDLCPRPNRRETVRNRALGAASMTGTAGGGRTYVVQEGDTLSSIARNELGKVSRWAEIYQLNRESLGKDYDYLTPGMRLVLPIRDSQSGDRTTRRDDRDALPIR